MGNEFSIDVSSYRGRQRLQKNLYFSKISKHTNALRIYFMSKIFLSHSTFDKEFVDQVYELLGAGRSVYDKVTFEKNSDLTRQIREGLEGCEFYALFLSSSALKSRWVQAEIDLANELKTQ